MYPRCILFFPLYAVDNSLLFCRWELRDLYLCPRQKPHCARWNRSNGRGKGRVKVREEQNCQCAATEIATVIQVTDFLVFEEPYAKQKELCSKPYRLESFTCLINIWLLTLFPLQVPRKQRGSLSDGVLTCAVRIVPNKGRVTLPLGGSGGGVRHPAGIYGKEDNLLPAWKFLDDPGEC